MREQLWGKGGDMQGLVGWAISTSSHKLTILRGCADETLVNGL